MDAIAELMALTPYLKVESAEDIRTPPVSATYDTLATCPHPDDLPISTAQMPNGRRMLILKSLLTSACERNCNYCAFRAGRDVRRATFTPDTLAKAFMMLYQAGKVEGIFLSSGIAGGGLRTEDRLLDTAEILRYKLGFRGYIHLKIMPGSDRAQVEHGMTLADRVSVNLEAPNTNRLANLAPQKIFLEELLTPLRWVEEIRRTQPPHLGWNGHWPSSCTQFVAGGSGETDLELLQTTDYLHNKLHLARVYFSGFNPIPDTPLENQPPTNPWREHRLYQAAFLLRDYGFTQEDLPYQSSGNLPLETDPKLAWARENLSAQPLEVNSADLPDLLRIPGIGPKGARAIVNARRRNPLRRVGDLQSLGIITKRAAPFILINGRQPPVQMTLF